VDRARGGKIVVRLKGGDPYVFGRGGEERLACRAADVPVEVVPGVTSAIAVAAAAGIPVTHRGVARGFTVVTGHEELAHVPHGGDHTLVLLMGVKRLSQTTDELIRAGHRPTTPAAVIERGFLPDQRVTVATLGELA
ncbi:uroporphyrinogen-III C-methyltransferase, partial [Aeromicrobium phragmitis]